MFLGYIDESGDDGFPNFSSELFVLSCLYMNESHWKENYYKIQKFRKILKDQFDFPIKQELHSKELITDKDPYHGKYSKETRKQIIFAHSKLFSTLNLRSISIVIDKSGIKRNSYDVLEKSLTYLIQRLENDMKKFQGNERFLLITDEGRVGKMTKTSRKLQKINFIPSLINTAPYRQEIKLMIEDPLPKNSKESYFIQLSDLVSFIVSLYAKQHLIKIPIEWANRIKSVLDYGDEINLLNIMKPSLNINASRNNEFGIVVYPK